MQANQLNQARFMLAAHECRQLPPDTGMEIAFAGRSNAGKSSAINKLTRIRQLARASRTPGRTQQMVVFTLGDGPTRLVDLPGYGYAKVSASLRQHWQEEIDRYLRQRQSLKAVVIIADIRHPLKPFDQQMLTFCAQSKLASLLLLTKADKLPRGRIEQQVQAARRWCRDADIETTIQSFSATSGHGVEAALAVIHGWLAMYG